MGAAVTVPIVVARRLVPDRTIALIKRFEGLVDGDARTPVLLEPIADPVGIWQVGWGYALFDCGRPVRDRAQAFAIWRERWPLGFTALTAEALLSATAQQNCDRVLRLLPGLELNDNELGALVSLAYNIGVGEVGGAPDFADSTVRRQLLNGNRTAAADAFRMWRYAGGHIVHGLELRREAERALFLTPVAA
jgi:lysozyme